jgi:hypothetical protein
MTEQQLAEIVVEAIRAATHPLWERVKELEARPVVKDAGVWEPGREYRPGDIVSHAGSGWICRTLHTSAGTSPDHASFRLFVKRGA